MLYFGFDIESIVLKTPKHTTDKKILAATPAVVSGGFFHDSKIPCLLKESYPLKECMAKVPYQEFF